ncbi:MAG: tyrosine-type recombinase/integrase [Clostridia bacterium]|nr:tyrosine-type recombinase/integrase [Clostridia bacterium]
MATIRKRGNTYQIRVSAGYDSNGKQIVKTKSWTPAPGMTERQIKKELNKQAVTFEQQVETGQFLNGTITFAEFADQWFKDYAEKQLRIKTITEYRLLMKRINPAIGHIRLSKLQPHHLMEFYNNLGEGGIRLDTKYKPCDDLKERIKAAGYTQKSLAAAAGVALSTVEGLCKGANARKDTADKIAAALGDNLFTPIERNNNKLSDKTISEYHRLISSILTAAVQWQVIPSNPCSRVKPPRVERKEAVSLDETQAAELIACLQSEPLKYRVAVMLTLYTGMRRGEVCGLDWSDVDLPNGLISVTKAVQYTAAGGLRESKTKTKSSNRIINIPPAMTELLKQHKRDQARRRFDLGDQWQYSGKVFTNECGGLLNPDTLSTWFKRFLQRNDLPNIHYHNLRHTAATLLIAGGVDIATVSKRLGHADKTTTLNIYTHAIQAADKAAAEKLQDIFQNGHLKRAN